MRKILLGFLMALACSAGAIVSGLAVHDHSSAAKGGATLLPALGGSSSTVTTIGTASLNVTSVNGQTGTQDLMTYSLPASALSVSGKAVRVTALFRVANNANAKTLGFAFGDCTNFSGSTSWTATASVSGRIKAEMYFVRDGSGNLRAYWWLGEVSMTAGTFQAARTEQQSSSSCIPTFTNAQIIKFTSTLAANNDLTMDYMHVEFLN